MDEMIDSTQNQYFEIRIKGHLSSERSRNFNGLELTELAKGETLICGKFKDQAHLFGILIRIRDMGIPLLSVNRARTETSPTKEF
jgi:hypothetical protein